MDGVFAVLALVNEARWNPSTKQLEDGVLYEIGRRMTTSEENAISRSTVVTPDCVIQRNHSTGYIAEAKLGLPKEVEAWDEDIRQLQKYDDALLGWWTAGERIDNHDILALIPVTRAVKFGDLLDSGVGDGKWSFGRPVSVVAFFKQSGGVKDFLTLKLERGTLRDADLYQRLRESRAISIDLLIVTYNDKKFIDSPPPDPYLLQIMWDHVFTRYAAEVPADPSTPKVLEVSVDRVTQDLQEYFGFKSSGPRSPEIPRQSWVRRALDLLVAFKTADRQGDGRYQVRYKRTRGDTLQKFGRLCHRQHQKVKDASSQNMSLFPDRSN